MKQLEGLLMFMARIAEPPASNQSFEDAERRVITATFVPENGSAREVPDIRLFAHGG